CSAPAEPPGRREEGGVEIAGRTVLVTGGGAGLGAATPPTVVEQGRAGGGGAPAGVVVERGGSVVVADVDTERGERVAAELGERARFVPTDVTDEASVGAAVAAALELGGPHVAVSCAGIAPAERVLGRGGPHSLARFVAAIPVNLVRRFNLTRLAAQAMAANEPGEDGERGV